MQKKRVNKIFYWVLVVLIFVVVGNAGRVALKPAPAPTENTTVAGPTPDLFVQGSQCLFPGMPLPSGKPQDPTLWAEDLGRQLDAALSGVPVKKVPPAVVGISYSESWPSPLSSRGPLPTGRRGLGEIIEAIGKQPPPPPPAKPLVRSNLGSGVLFAVQAGQTWGMTTSAILPAGLTPGEVSIQVQGLPQPVAPSRLFAPIADGVIVFTIDGEHPVWPVAESLPEIGAAVTIKGDTNPFVAAATPTLLPGTVLGQRDLRSLTMNTYPPRNGPANCLAIKVKSTKGPGGGPVLDGNGRIVGLVYLSDNRGTLLALPVTRELIDKVKDK